MGYASAVIDAIRPAIKDVGGAARIYYAAECRAAEYDASGRLQLRFPGVDLQQPPRGVVGMNALARVFRNDPNVRVVQDRSGMIRITIGNVSTALLQTRLQGLSLNPDEQFSAPSAILRIYKSSISSVTDRSQVRPIFRRQ